MLSWHPWGNWVIGKLGRPLPKFHFLGHNSIIPQDKIVVSTSRFHGQWFWLDHCREDPAICICIIMQIKSAITEIASLPKNDDLSDHACYGNKSKDDPVKNSSWNVVQENGKQKHYCSTRTNKNLAIANRSRVSCAHDTSKASIGLITHDLEIEVKGHSRSPETEPLDRSYTTYY